MSNPIPRQEYIRSGTVRSLNVEEELTYQGVAFVPSAATDEKAKVSSNDTTPGYLDGKLVAGSGITLTTNNDGGNETLTITANIDLSAEAGSNLSALRVVRLDATNKAVYADNDTDTNANAVGITTIASILGATASIRYAGVLEDSGWSWTQGPIYLGNSGTLTQTAPTGGLIVREVARAIAANKIIIDIEPLIITV
jgi:hypothetical protein